MMQNGYTQTIRTARKPKPCWECGRVISAGERYLDCLMSPGYDFNQSGNWEHAPLHRRCSDMVPEWAADDARAAAAPA
jgi:hypothetical protein